MVNTHLKSKYTLFH